MSWVQVKTWIIGEIIKFIVKHANNILGFIGNNSIFLLVPKYWNGVFSFSVVGKFVQIPYTERIGNWVRKSIFIYRWKRTTNTVCIPKRLTIWISKDPSTMTIVRIVRFSFLPNLKFKSCEFT